MGRRCEDQKCIVHIDWLLFLVCRIKITWNLVPFFCFSTLSVSLSCSSMEIGINSRPIIPLRSCLFVIVITVCRCLLSLHLPRDAVQHQPTSLFVIVIHVYRDTFTCSTISCVCVRCVHPDNVWFHQNSQPRQLSLASNSICICH